MGSMGQEISDFHISYFGISILKTKYPLINDILRKIQISPFYRYDMDITNPLLI